MDTTHNWSYDSFHKRLTWMDSSLVLPGTEKRDAAAWAAAAAAAAAAAVCRSCLCLPGVWMARVQCSNGSFNPLFSCAWERERDQRLSTETFPRNSCSLFFPSLLLLLPEKKKQARSITLLSLSRSHHPRLQSYYLHSWLTELENPPPSTRRACMHACREQQTVDITCLAGWLAVYLTLQFPRGRRICFLRRLQQTNQDSSRSST